MKIHNIEGMTLQGIQNEINNGGRFVLFPYVVSLAIITLQRSSDIYLIKSNESAFGNSLKYGMLTTALGWWGIPWGPIYSLGAIYHNMRGGKNITMEVMNSLSSSMGNAPASTSQDGYNIPDFSNQGSSNQDGGGYNIPGASGSQNQSGGTSNYNIR